MIFRKCPTAATDDILIVKQHHNSHHMRLLNSFSIKQIYVSMGSSSRIRSYILPVPSHETIELFQYQGSLGMFGYSSNIPSFILPVASDVTQGMQRISKAVDTLSGPMVLSMFVVVGLSSLYLFFPY